MNIELQLYGSYGIPSAATTLAYDSIQRLLLVATTDGRIKLVGTACIDRTLTSPLATATLSLHVLPNTGCFLRLDVAGAMELWCIQKRKCLYTLDPPGIADNITACCPLIHTPFVLVGCGSGALRVVGLLNGADELVGPARPVEALQWMGYEMQVAEMNVPEDSELQEIVCMRYGEHDVEVLLRHEYSTVTALSMADREVLGQATFGSDSEDQAHQSDVTSICWASHTLTQILTGHEDGSIVHWHVQQGQFIKCREYAILDDDQRDAIHSLSMVLDPSMSIIVCGGNMADAPQSVSLIHVDPVEVDGQRCPGEVRGISHVPWLGRLQGFALVRPRGSLKMSDAPTGVIALTEGGYMCIHDIATGKTEPFVGDFQANAVVSTQLVLIPRLAGRTDGFVFEQLQARAPATSSSAAWHWALHSGALHAEGLEAGAVPAQEVLITGHDNGNVLLWDVSHVTPQRLSVLACGCRAVVTCARLHEATGLLAAGHATGEVNVAFWSPDSDKDTATTVLAAEHSTHTPRGQQRKQENENWLHVLQVVGSEVVPSKDHSVVDMAWCVNMHPMTLWLAVAWAGGQVGIIDFSKGSQSPVWLWEQQVTVEAISSVTFMRVASKARADEDTELVLLVVTADGSFRSLHANTGDMLAPHWTTPKTKEPLIACLPLSLDGSPAQASDLDGKVSLVANAAGWKPLHSEEPVPPTQLTTDADTVADTEQTDPATMPSIEPSSETVLAEAGGQDAEVALPETAPAGEEKEEEVAAEAEGTSGEKDAGDSSDEANWEEQLQSAAKIEQKTGSNRKKGIKGFLTSAKRLTAQVGSVVKDAREVAAESTHWMSRRRSQKDSSNLGTEVGTDGSASLAVFGASGDVGSATETPGPTSPKHNPMSSSVPLMSLPSTAEWLLLVSKSTVRLYPAPAAISGNHRTTEKMKLDFDIDSAAVVAVPLQKPMLVGWSAASGLQMISLPGLDGCASQDLQAVTGWKWRWHPNTLAKSHIKRLFATCTSTGLVSVVGPCMELLMLGLCRDRPDLHIPHTFFDPDLASAAFSAECHNAPSTMFGDGARGKLSPRKEQPAPARKSVLFKSMKKQPKDTVSDESHAADSGTGQGSPSAGCPCCGASPELRALFQDGFEQDDNDELVPHTSAPVAPAPATTTSRPSVAATAPRPGGASSSAAGSSSGASSSSAAPSKVGARSAAQIKEAYGFKGKDRAATAQQGVAGTAAVMAENISRLNERGERLSRLEERTADMVSDAEGFAAMAKKLAEKRNKPWWKSF